MSSRRVAPREVTVVASQLRRSQPSGPCVRFVDLALPRGAPPAVVRFLAFRNHYAHAVTVRARDAGQQHGEFVTSQAGNHVRAAHVPREQRRDLLEDGIATGMAMGVVDGLEAVQIDVDQHAGFTVPAC